MVKFDVPTYADIYELSETMRQCDLDELEALTCLTPFEAINQSVRNSDNKFLFSVRSKGNLLCICGCSKTGNPWLIGTNHLKHYNKSLTKHAINGVRMMLDEWPKLSNVIDARNKQSIRWLKLLGFKFNETLQIKPGFNAIRFTMEKQNVTAIDEQSDDI